MDLNVEYLMFGFVCRRMCLMSVCFMYTLMYTFFVGVGG